jgi:hypothetical protein
VSRAHIPSRMPRARPAFAPVDMPPSSAPAAADEEAVAEMEAVTEARPATVEAGLVVGDLVATMRVDAALVGELFAVLISSAVFSSSASWVDEGFLAVAVVVGLRVDLGLSAVVVASSSSFGRLIVSGGGSCTPFEVSSGSSSPAVLVTCTTAVSITTRCRRTRCACWCAMSCIVACR